ncbi:hypothetical protein I5G78_gp032 [Mycobacterium phage Unicorn]|uniref:DUF7183 domain-containing protein n=1 Tax=Mycobacterium phage Unicorn TaxID=2015825 RepID=A0A222ZLB6_9CAUD|nr:hypothetical protein I5G78_gp032 [Mycobacterium phage Unicorn]ASR85082.1 hypothetical protein SEA_UNICORN_74 [Mycobacterium phage Unicorn]
MAVRRMSELFNEDRRAAVSAIAGVVGDIALGRCQPTEDLLGSIVDAVARRVTPLLPPAPVESGAVLVELSLAEVDKMAEVVRARIAHPSHTPVQAIRAGLVAVNNMRADALVAAAAPAPKPARPKVPRPADPPHARKVARLGMAERGGEWMDTDGDRWRWSWSECVWQYKPLNPAPYEAEAEWIDCPSQHADKAPNPSYGPFTEVPRS